MKTLVVVAHPNMKQSGTQQFLLHQFPTTNDVTWHELDPEGNFDVSAEKALLMAHDRIIFQFPLYWYSVPVNLRQWQDMVLERGFAYGNGATLQGKEFGIVVSLGEPLDEYQAGGSEQFTMSEILKPLQAMAHKLRWRYLKPLVISQFAYLTDNQRLRLIVSYQQYLTLANDSFEDRQKWFINQLTQRIELMTVENEKAKAQAIYEQLQDNFDNLAELHWTVDLIRDEEE